MSCFSLTDLFLLCQSPEHEDYQQDDAMQVESAASSNSSVPRLLTHPVPPSPIAAPDFVVPQPLLHQLESVSTHTYETINNSSDTANQDRFREVRRVLLQLVDLLCK